MRFASVLIALLLAPARNTLYAPPQDPSQALRQMVQAYQTAWNTHDAAAVVAFYTEDADQVMQGGATTVGREALTQWWRTRFAAMEPGRKIALTVTAVRLVTPQVAIVNTIATTGGQDAHGKELSGATDRGTWVVIQKDGHWLMAALRVGPAEEGAAR